LIVARPGGYEGRKDGTMFYVYMRDVKSGKEQFVRMSFETAADAIKHIAKCYEIDRDLRQLGNYYYFMKQH
jgi:hypothetical protein